MRLGFRELEAILSQTQRTVDFSVNAEQPLIEPYLIDFLVRDRFRQNFMLRNPAKCA